jgi:anti-sigma B factor antagonist
MTLVYVPEAKMDGGAIRKTLEIFEALAKAEQNVMLDMSAVEYIDCSGVGAIVYLLKRLRVSGHCVKVVNLKGQPSRLFADLRLYNALGG